MDLIKDNSFFINLDRRVDRYNSIRQSLDNNNFNFVKKYSAVDGSTLSDDILKKIVSPKNYNELNQLYRTEHSQLTKGAIGCALSHINLWKNLVDSDKEYMLIFEDDIKIHPYLYKVMEKVMVLLSKLNSDIFLFYNTCPFNDKNTCYEETDISSVNVNKQHMTIDKVNYFWGLNCYIISKKAAKILINSAFPIEKQLDHYISDKIMSDNLNVYRIKPNLVNNGGFLSSDIQNICIGCDFKLHPTYKISYNKYYLVIQLAVLLLLLLIFFYTIYYIQKWMK